MFTFFFCNIFLGKDVFAKQVFTNKTSFSILQYYLYNKVTAVTGDMSEKSMKKFSGEKHRICNCNVNKCKLSEWILIYIILYEWNIAKRTKYHVKKQVLDMMIFIIRRIENISRYYGVESIHGHGCFGIHLKFTQHTSILNYISFSYIYRYFKTKVNLHHYAMTQR